MVKNLNSQIISLKNRIIHGGFFSNVLTLMTGTTIAQVISIAISPILTRIYTPEDFGIFAVYMGIASVLGIVATGRYELAVMLPEKDTDAASLVALSGIIVSFVSLILLIVVWVFNSLVTGFFRSPKISGCLYFIPLTVFLTGMYQSLNYWVNRKQQYKRLAITRVSQSAVTSLTNLGMGVMGFGANGLVAGGIVGQVIATVILGWKVISYRNVKTYIIKGDRIISSLVRYKRFPVFSIPADFINAISNQMPIFLLTNFFGITIAGFYSLTQRVLATPITLIANSIVDVFKQRAAVDFATYGNCKNIYVSTFKYLICISVIPFILFFLLAPNLFSFLFGTRWRVAGEYAQILSMLFFLRVIASPLSYVIYIAEKQNYDLIWQIVLCIFTLISFVIGRYLNSAKIGILCFSVSYSVMYAFYLLLSYHFAKGNKDI